ncbi:MAG TPA: hypothetical protein PLS87_11225 [Ferruginibacter sp.]|nr:hypothetical protein [Ferruginibacter sp.]HRP50454.1 hypothetical protein [Ferruginibacter sp.]
MEKAVLKKDITDRIRREPVLFGRVAEITGYGLTYLHRILAQNDKGEDTDLININNLRAIAAELGVQDINELLEQVAVA